MDRREKQLLDCFRALSNAQRDGLLDYAQYLRERHNAEPDPKPEEPLPIPRPQQESVVAAMQRLSATYPMIDTGTLLNEASSLMAQHLVQGREAGEVIDQLEALFAERFSAVLSER